MSYLKLTDIEILVVTCWVLHKSNIRTIDYTWFTSRHWSLSLASNSSELCSISLLYDVDDVAPPARCTLETGSLGCAGASVPCKIICHCVIWAAITNRQDE